jgi:serine/threonine-protein kinase RIO1
LFHCARLIHGDLSEYNILVCSSEQVQNALDKSEDAKRDLQVVLIDFGQAVERNHPSALDLLKRDLHTLNDFFVKQEITILEQEECEDFVMREFEGDSSNVEEEDNDLIVKDDTLDGWRHTPKDWNDQQNFDWVYDRLQQMNVVSR